MLLLPPVRVDGLVSVEIELLSSLTDWHTGLVPAVVPELVLGVVADTAGDEVFEVDFELPLEPQPANTNAVECKRCRRDPDRTLRPEHRFIPRD